ncbi:hypothetical protein C8Q76DRAFT_573716, partial [Earliella scabrosa]
PEWIQNAVDYFNLLVAGGARWTELVNAWQAFEIHMGYPTDSRESSRLSAVLRPEELAMWMKEGRSYERLPDIRDPVDFALRWQAWWASLQPACRRGESAWPLARVEPQDGSEWDSIWRGGPCGLFLAVMGLAWW